MRRTDRWTACVLQLSSSQSLKDRRTHLLRKYDALALQCPLLPYGHSDAQPWASECSDIKNYKWRLNPVWHRMLYSCTCMATVGVKGLNVYCCLRKAAITEVVFSRYFLYYYLHWFLSVSRKCLHELKTVDTVICFVKETSFCSPVF